MNTRNLIHQAAIEELTGKVEIQTGGRGPWRLARLHDPLGMEDRVRTGASSNCLVIIGDVGLVEVEERAEVRLGNLRQVQGQTSVRDVVTTHLERGTRRQSFIHRPGRMGEYRVVTPLSLVAGVRGTCFEMTLDESAEKLKCVVLDGVLDLTGVIDGREWSRTVTTGCVLEVESGVIPPEPSAADPDDLKRLWPIQEAAQQDSALPVVPEKRPGDVECRTEPAALSFLTEGLVEKTATGRRLVFTGAAASRSVRISFAGVPLGRDLILDAGRESRFMRQFDAWPIILEGVCSVVSEGNRTIVTFSSLRVAYTEEGVMDNYRIPCIVELGSGGVATFNLTVTPGEEVEFE